MRLVSVLLLGGASLASATAASAQEVDWQKVDDALGRKAAVVSGDVHRYGFPRSDLTATLRLAPSELKTTDVRKLRTSALARGEETLVEIALTYNVSHMTISRLKTQHAAA